MDAKAVAGRGLHGVGDLGCKFATVHLKDKALVKTAANRHKPLCCGAKHIGQQN